jgi:hypothetical protein
MSFVKTEHHVHHSYHDHQLAQPRHQTWHWLPPTSSTTTWEGSREERGEERGAEEREERRETPTRGEAGPTTQ